MARAVAADTGSVWARSSASRRWTNLIVYRVLFALTVLFMGPFLFALMTSFKAPEEIFVFPPRFFPAQWRFANYPQALFTQAPFPLFFRNTILITLLAMLGQIVSATLVAYGFARFRFPGRDALFLLVISTLILPEEVTIIPTFLMFKAVGWLDSWYPLILPAYFGGGAFSVFLLRQFFLTIPRDYDEAARIDGASSLRVLWEILVPLCRPAITTVAIFSFLFHWNAFIEPLIFLNTPEKFTISLGLRYFQTSPMEAGEPKEHLLMAGTIIMAAPCVLLFFAAQRYFVDSVASTGLKA